MTCRADDLISTALLTIVASGAGLIAVNTRMELNDTRRDLARVKAHAAAWQAEANRRLVEFGERPIEVNP